MWNNKYKTETNTIVDINEYLAGKSKHKVLECDSCRKEFMVTVLNINVQKMKHKATGYVVEMTYFTCSHCGDIYSILIDDGVTISLKTDYQKQYAKLTKKSEQGLTPTEGEVKSLHIKRKRLEKAYIEVKHKVSKVNLQDWAFLA